MADDGDSQRNTQQSQRRRRQWQGILGIGLALLGVLAGLLGVYGPQLESLLRGSAWTSGWLSGGAQWVPPQLLSWSEQLSEDDAISGDSASLVGALSAEDERERLLSLWAPPQTSPRTEEPALPLSGPPPHPLSFDAPQITAVARLHDTLFLAAGARLFTLDLTTRKLETLPLAPGSVAGNVRQILVDGTDLFLGLEQGGELVKLLRLQSQSGLLNSLPVAGPLSALTLSAHQVWGSPKPQASPAGAPPDARPPLAKLIRISPMLEQPERVLLPSEMPSSPISALTPLGSGLLAAHVDGTVEQLTFAASPALTVLGSGAAGPGPVLGMAAWGENVAFSSEHWGLTRVLPSGKLEPLDPAARLTHLAPFGEHVWGMEGTQLARYNGQLKRRVHYTTSLHAPAPPDTTSPLSSALHPEESLEEVLGLFPDAEGVIVATPRAILRYSLERLKLEPLALAVFAQGPQAGAAEVDTVLRQIANLTPGERRDAFEALLMKSTLGYDEVFLVGLNEDDPLTLEIVSEYFRTHHIPAAIEPLLDVLLQIQDDKALRRHLTEVLTSFGEPVIGPVVRRLTIETPEALSGGAREALEQVLVGTVEQGGLQLLNPFLARASAEWLLVYGRAEHMRSMPPPVNAETFRLLGERLKRTRDPQQVEGALRVLVRLARRPDLPPSIESLVPLLVTQLRGPFRTQALYALALIGDTRAIPALEALFQSDPSLRFWSLQALGSIGGPEALAVVPVALKDSRSEVRLAAAALSRLELVGEAAPVLRQLLLDEPEGLCVPCVEALSALRLEPTQAPLMRNVLSARLPRVRREEQVPLLIGLAGVGDEALARQVMGWVELEILAPARVGRVSLAPGPTHDVLVVALGLVAAYGGDGGRKWLSQVVPELPEVAARGAGEALLLANAMPLGLSQVLHHAILGSLLASNQSEGNIEKAQILQALEGQISLLRPLLFALIPARADPQTRAVLESILLRAPGAVDREEAARALFLLRAPESIPALTRALQDPYFQAGPFPQFYFPVRRVAARALELQGIAVQRRADRHITRMP